ncbi:MAG: manganese efflux pump MntP [Planctomycetota bacterium]|jgi:putative Mn2+ efflux pump MntP
MGLLTIIVIAVGLAMDAFAVSIVSGSACKQLRVRHALRMALFFGAFQAFMPLIGALAGLTVKKHIAGWDHWLAFALLTAVGAKMIYESFKIKPEKQGRDPAGLLVLLALAVATSIDALAVGVTLSLLVTGLFLAVTVIGAVTFILSYLGVYIGKKFGHFFESGIEILGGLILIALGAKILLQHLIF